MGEFKTLALFGGEPLVADHSQLKIEWPIVNNEDRNAVLRAFDNRDFSGRSSTEVANLEREFSEYIGMPYATALNSGTAAIHAALFSLGVGNGDEVIVPNLTFIAPAMAVIHNGSTPIFADIDKKTYNISAENIKVKITNRTKAIIIVHMHGIPVDMDPILELCKKSKLKLIEDVAQAPGARYKGKLLGSLGDASAFSIMAQKNLATCGEGGILLSRNERDKNRAEMLRIYGEILLDNGERKYNSYTIGWNYTLNPIQAAMARVQLKRFPQLTKTIRRKGLELAMKLEKLHWVVPPYNSSDFESVFHFYRVRTLGEYFGYMHAGRFRQAVQDALNAEGLNVRLYQNTPVSGQPFFMSFKANRNSIVENYPGTTDVLRNTFILGAIGASPPYLLCPGTIDAYVDGFKKIEANIGQLCEYADRLNYADPWNTIPVISDSFGSEYTVQAPI